MVSNIAQILLRPVFGVLSDRIGRKLFISLAIIFYFLSYLVQAFARTALDIILASFLVGVGVSMLWTTLMAYTSEISSEPKEEISMLFTISFAGAVFGSLLSGVIAENMGWRPTFLISAFITLIAFLLASITLRESLRTRTSTPFRRSLKQSANIAFKTTLKVNSIGLKPVLRTYIPVILIDGGLSQTIAGFVLTLDSVITSAMQRPSAKLSTKKWFSMKLINVSGLLSLVLFGMLATNNLLGLAILSYLMYSGLSGLLPTPQLTEATETMRGKGSGAGGFGVGLSSSRLLASTVASLGGGLIDIGISPSIVAIETAVFFLLFVSMLGIFVFSKDSNENSYN